MRAVVRVKALAINLQVAEALGLKMVLTVKAVELVRREHSPTMRLLTVAMAR
jgi:hypothetical protein